ncbi:MAG TPA: hypothetical protein VI756_25745 [Blastocatellia bacterium]
MSAQAPIAPATAWAPASPASPATTAAPVTHTGIVAEVINELKKIKSSIIHFLTTNKAGQLVVTIVQKFEALPAVQADITTWEKQGQGVLANTLTSLDQGGGLTTLDDALSAAEQGLVGIAKEVGQTISGGALKNIMSVAVNTLSTDPVVGPILQKLGV